VTKSSEQSGASEQVRTVKPWRVLRYWRVLMLIAVFAIGLVQLGVIASKSGTEHVAAPADCAAWDQEASRSIAALISDNSLAAELRLDEAIRQLRRARRNCRTGSITLAGRDYASLRQSFPIATGSIAVPAPGTE
jgi:hypothetical protein